MANSWFQFKQFKVNQDKTAMKVGTDGVLLGSWVQVADAADVLDVGTGTGLIALMLAQRSSNTRITAIDIEEDAVLQAQQNALESPWSSRIAIEQADYCRFRSAEVALFDLIVSNPPYFRQSLKPQAHQRAVARHSHQLPYDSLIENTNRLLKDDGAFAVILPYVEGSVFIALAAAQGLYCRRKTSVYSTPKSEVRRLLLQFTKEAGSILEDELVIEASGRHGYSAEYLALTKDFYLFG